eukprot:SAG11_NODE_239_length_11783_cov_52.724923_8_plen_231_part_00
MGEEPVAVKGSPRHSYRNLRPRGANKKVIKSKKEMNAHLYVKIQPSSGFRELNAAASAKTKEKYRTRVRTKDEKEESEKLKRHFEAQLTNKIDESQINATAPEFKDWARELVEDHKYKCFEEIPVDRPPRKGDAQLIIEDRKGELPPAPNRQYKTPHALIPELEKFISELLEKKWIEPSASEFASPVLILKKPNGKGYRSVVDLRQINKRSKPFAHYMPDIDECPTSTSV